MKKNKISLILIFLVTISVLFSSCAASNTKNYAEESAASEDYATEYAEDAATEVTSESASPSSVSTQVSNRKIVRTVHSSLETKEYDQGVSTLDTITRKYNGYYAQSEIEGEYSTQGRAHSRTAYFEVKIPAESLDDFLDEVKDNFHVISLSEQSEEITRSYYDNQAALEAQEERKARLESLLDDARDLEYILEIEREISYVIEEIKYLHSQQEAMKASVSMSTVYINLHEVLTFQEQEKSGPSFGDQISIAFHSAINGFVRAFQGIILFVVRFFPLLIFFGLVAALIIFLLRRNNKDSEKKKQQMQQWKNATGPMGSPGPGPMPGAPASPPQQPQPHHPYQQQQGQQGQQPTAPTSSAVPQAKPADTSPQNNTGASEKNASDTNKAKK